MFQKRAEILPRLMELQGRVNFIMAKIDETNNTEFSKQSALAVYQDGTVVCLVNFIRILLTFLLLLSIIRIGIGVCT